ncbi:Sucrase/ferredoxin-like-domain-containing protein [Roridomyces roridus]|uniref:Sucrase/ferredoxin-like-domain-containing protein n=1 Tax=Roridomyces roridus TaxID=1738132 RepID=A0AAD7C4I6_9AGAR|nr:Sucrase/ferredoxin-like-domain-containing protein [Roridomyces roridus]
MSTLRQLRALILGEQHPADDCNLHSTALRRRCSRNLGRLSFSVPTHATRATLSTPDDFQSTTNLLCWILISTGKSDWDREITETQGSLAAYVAEIQPPPLPPTPPPISIDMVSEKAITPVPGVFSSTDSNSTRLSILNGSHQTVTDVDDLETVIVLPDYTMVVGVPSTLDGAKELWHTALDPPLPRMGLTPKTSSFQTWVLPYSCIIFLCSHKRRDNRCAISAPKLEQAFIRSLTGKSWTVDTQLEHVLKALPGAKKALILKTSHIGGHKYAGNCIIYTPQGSSVWYGRVTTHEVESIVVSTLEGGLVLPPLLRGGLDLSRPGCPTLHDW